MKKIGILIDRLNVGGVEKIALEEVRGLQNLGEDAHLVVLRRKGVVDNAFLELQKHTSIIFLDDRLPKIFRFSFAFPPFSFFSSFHITYPLLIPFTIKNKEFDYLIVHGTYSAFSAITIRLIKKVPFSVFIWDPISYIIKRVYSDKFSYFMKKVLSSIANILDKIIVNSSDFILVGGPAHNKIFQKINPNKEIIEIPPGINPIKKLVYKKKGYILLVTAWKKGKKPEYIFELLKIIPQLKVKIVGKWIEKNYKKQYINEIKRRGLIKNISVIGSVTEDQLNKYYQEALALLQINNDKGFGMPVLESASRGTTFIIPKGQGVCKLFKNNKDGFFIKEMDTIEIAKKINLLYKDRKLSYKMGKSAWKRIRMTYTWKRHCKELIKIVKKSFEE